ncbi:MAG: hypothetical protein GXY83_40905 [Rhodopirellula sp.]|nr:hypothetical protein [Rhodopirellula sp.]
MRHRVLFAYAVGVWVLAFAIVRGLSPFVVDLYRGTQATPFTLQMWWQVLPWLVVCGLWLDRWLQSLLEHKRDRSRSALKYYVCLWMAFAFIILSFLPLVVVLPMGN